MSQRAQFDVDLDESAPIRFAELSGDWNPLHTDPKYAATTQYGRPVLHGAFAAGLLSRMAGMFLPGTDCLLHGIRLRFIAPIVPPSSLRVEGTVVRSSAEGGSVSVLIVDRQTGNRLVEGGYDYGRHRPAPPAALAAPEPHMGQDGAAVLVTGASGGLGQALVERLGGRAIPLSRGAGGNLLPSGATMGALLGGRSLAAIVHCGWPTPDNVPLLGLTGAADAVGYHVAAPLVQSIELAQALREHGEAGSLLVLVGSTFAAPGRHAFRKPLYSIAKSIVPALTGALAIELGAVDRRVASVVFDVLDGGMNRGMSPIARSQQAGRFPSGQVPTVGQAADQIMWLLQNGGMMVSGSVISLSGGALP